MGLKCEWLRVFFFFFCREYSWHVHNIKIVGHMGACDFQCQFILKRVNGDTDLNATKNQERREQRTYYTIFGVYVSHFSYRERILFYSYAYTDYQNVTCTIRHMCAVLFLSEVWRKTKQINGKNRRRLEYEPNNIKPNCDLCEPLNLFKPPTYHTTSCKYAVIFVTVFDDV